VFVLNFALITVIVSKCCRLL